MQIVATLPSGLAPGTFDLTVTNSSGNSVVFDLTYGAIGPQGPAGAAGPTGAQGPAGPIGATGPQGARGLTGAPGAPGPAGANGIGFSFLNAFDPYATYAVNNVVTYNGSSYVATVPNGPNPSGPTPDKNPSWSLMASIGATGQTGAQGSVGPMGPLGLQGPIGPAGPTGATGPQGPRGATGAAGPAGTNGTSFVFLSAYNPYSAYALDNVVTYNGSSYIAIVPNGPNPNGPAPDQNPNWSLMASAGTPGAVGAAGPAGPAGPMGPVGFTGPAGATGPMGPAGPQGLTGSQGPQGLMGNTGPAGPVGPAGPIGPAGSGSGVLSYATGSDNVHSVNLAVPNQSYPVFSITLPNAGTYFIWGQALVIAPLQTSDTNLTYYEMNSYGCSLSATPDVLTDNGVGQFMAYGGTISDHATIVATQPNDVVTLSCSYSGLVNPNANVVVTTIFPVISAIQVK